MFQPLTDGQVVEFQRTVGHEDGEDEKTDADGDVRGCGQVWMAGLERHLEVDERIVGDVKRIGDFAQELAYSLTSLVGDLTSCTKAYDEREADEDDKGFVETVHPELIHVSTAQTGHRQHFPPSPFGEGDRG